MSYRNKKRFIVKQFLVLYIHIDKDMRDKTIKLDQQNKPTVIV